jgi:MFS family permease
VSRAFELRGLPLQGAVALALAAGWSMTSVSAGAPAIAQRYGVSLSAVGLASGALWVTFALAQAPAGRASDRFPAGRICVVAATGMVVANIVCALVPLLAVSTVLRLAAGACGGTVMVVAAFSVAASGSRGQGLVGGVTAAGSALAVVSMPIVEHVVGWRAAYVGGALLAGLALIFVIAPTTACDRPSRRRAPGPARRLPADAKRRLLRLSTVVGCSLTAGFALGGWAPSFLDQQSNIGPVLAALAGGAVVGGSIVTRPLGGLLAERGSRVVVRASLVCLAAASATLALSPSAEVSVAALVVVGLAAGLPFAAVVDRAAMLVPGATGRAVGLLGTAGTLLGMCGVVLIGVAVDAGTTTLMFAGIATLATVSATLTWMDMARPESCRTYKPAPPAPIDRLFAMRILRADDRERSEADGDRDG